MDSFDVAVLSIFSAFHVCLFGAVVLVARICVGGKGDRGPGGGIPALGAHKRGDRRKPVVITDERAAEMEAEEQKQHRLR